MDHAPTDNDWARDAVRWLFIRALFAIAAEFELQAWELEP